MNSSDRERNKALDIKIGKLPIFPIRFGNSNPFIEKKSKKNISVLKANGRF